MAKVASNWTDQVRRSCCSSTRCSAHGTTVLIPAKALHDCLHVLWCMQEDERLRDLIDQHGAKRWSLIASLLGSKGSKQVRAHPSNS